MKPRYPHLTSRLLDYVIWEQESSTAKKPKRRTTKQPASCDRSDLPIAEQIRSICEQLGSGGKLIERQDILRLAREQGIKEGSVLPADYCDNTKTGQWSEYNFLHSVGRGRYRLLR